MYATLTQKAIDLICKTDFQLLCRQKHTIVKLRSEFTDGSGNFEVLSGIIHFLDYIQDEFYPEHLKLVLITDLASETQYFTLDESSCRDEVELDVYRLVFRYNQAICQGQVHGCQRNGFSEADRINLIKYGIGNVFRVK